MPDDDRFMALALKEAEAALEHEDVPIGAVVVAEGQVIGAGHNRREVDSDPTAHAEILALRQAAAKTGDWRLSEATIFVTLEPCAMCAAAIVQARIRRLVFAAPDPKAGAVTSLFELCDDERLNHRVAWQMGTARAPAEQLLSRFFAQRRAR
ncbi:MAG: tRNA adenosine(34) deaminase TadA [Actinomycetota bacterium]